MYLSWCVSLMIYIVLIFTVASTFWMCWIICIVLGILCWGRNWCVHSIHIYVYPLRMLLFSVFDGVYVRCQIVFRLFEWLLLPYTRSGVDGKDLIATKSEVTGSCNWEAGLMMAACIFRILLCRIFFSFYLLCSICLFVYLPGGG